MLIHYNGIYSIISRGLNKNFVTLSCIKLKIEGNNNVAQQILQHKAFTFKERFTCQKDYL